MVSSINSFLTDLCHDKSAIIYSIASDNAILPLDCQTRTTTCLESKVHSGFSLQIAGTKSSKGCKFCDKRNTPTRQASVSESRWNADGMHCVSTSAPRMPSRTTSSLLSPLTTPKCKVILRSTRRTAAESLMLPIFHSNVKSLQRLR